MASGTASRTHSGLRTAEQVTRTPAHSSASPPRSSSRPSSAPPGRQFPARHSRGHDAAERLPDYPGGHHGEQPLPASRPGRRLRRGDRVEGRRHRAVGQADGDRTERAHQAAGTPAGDRGCRRRHGEREHRGCQHDGRQFPHPADARRVFTAVAALQPGEQRDRRTGPPSGSRVPGRVPSAPRVLRQPPGRPAESSPRRPGAGALRASRARR